MSAFKKYLSIEFSYIKFSIINLMEYRSNFLFRAGYELIGLIITMLYFFVVFSKITELAGWTVDQVAFTIIYAFLIDSIFTMFFVESISSIPSYIVSGSLDMIMIKPVNKQFMLTCTRPCMPQIFNILLSSLLMVYIAVRYDLNIGIISIAGFILCTIASIVIIYSVFSVVVFLSFWFIRIGSLSNIIYMFHIAGSRPGDIYAKGFKFILTFIIPFLIIINVPVEVIYNGNLMLFFKYSLPISIVFFLLSTLLLKIGLKKYTSAGG